MNGLQKKKVHDIEKPFPGCMGRMVNIFELGPGLSGKRLLTDNAHRDCSPLSRSQDEATKKTYGSHRDFPEAKNTGSLGIGSTQVTEESRKKNSNGNSSGTPIKMLIAEEMSKEPESMRKPLNIVARLMGLDGMPAQQPTMMERSLQEQHLLDVSAKPSYHQEENGFKGKQMSSKMTHCETHVQLPVECKDIYEVNCWTSKSTNAAELSQKVRPNKQTVGKNLMYNDQKYSEDTVLHQSKEFQDALEVLGSNKDLFLKFLEQPSSLLVKHLQELQCIPPPPETKRITILKPSEKVGIKSDIQAKKYNEEFETNESTRSKNNWRSAVAHAQADNCFSQPTRIVVLKPIVGKIHDIKTTGISPSSSPALRRKFWLDNKSCQDYVLDTTEGSGEKSDEIMQQTWAQCSTSGRNKKWLPSVSLGGYVGDESSFGLSECDYVEEGNSDSEITILSSRQSLDYSNKYDSLSFSSLSQASHLSESSVSTEARKRLSERWALMTSDACVEPQRHSRSSNTLGEMLSLPESTKKQLRYSNMGMDGGNNISHSKSCGGEDELEISTSCSSRNGRAYKSVEDEHRKLLRSRSLPSSSVQFEDGGMTVDVPHLKHSNSVGPLEIIKQKSRKSLFKGKVSSLFFSRSKKSNKVTSCTNSAVNSEDNKQSENPKTLRFYEIKKLQMDSRVSSEEIAPSESPCKNCSSASFWIESSPISPPSEEEQFLVKPDASENSCESQDQPSPVSVLEAPFEDEINSSESHGNASEPFVLPIVRPSEATTKSHLIESVTCSLSWDDATARTMSSTSLGATLRSPPNMKAEEDEWFAFVEKLLSVAGLDDRPNSVIHKWYSPEWPLDPELLDRCTYWEEDRMGNLNSGMGRSERKLVFDSVNAIMVEIVMSYIDPKLWTTAVCKAAPHGVQLLDSVWLRIKEWSSCRMMDSCSVVERVARQESGGLGWMEQMGMEVNDLKKEIAQDVLGELVGEVVADLTCRL